MIVHAKDESFRLGIIGDLHNPRDEVDVAQFSRMDYDLLYVTGDLGGGTSESCLRIAPRISTSRSRDDARSRSRCRDPEALLRLD